MTYDIFLKGERIQKGYEPSENLKSALVSFSNLVKQKRPDAIVEFGQTDRDVEIRIRLRLDPRSPFMDCITYYVWEEGGELFGSS